MAQWDGNYSRDMTPSSRRKQYAYGLYQQGKELADADVNDSRKLLYEKMRNFLELFSGDSVFFDDAFAVLADGSNNDFPMGAGSGYVKGHEAYQGLGANYVNLGATQEDVNLHSVSTLLTATVLTDSSMNWAVNELAGRVLVPNITDGSTFSILSNTATTITVAGDMTVPASAGDPYLVKMSTPVGSNRTDTVWLNVYLDEISAVDDPYLNHNLGSGIELDRRVKVRTIVMVEQGTVAYADYTDADGLDHYMVKLATIQRYDGVDAIALVDVTDERNTSVSGEGGGGARTVAVSASDLTPQTLSGKLVAGTGISLATLNPGGVEQLEVSAPGATTDEKVAAALGNNAFFLQDAVEAGSNITLALSGVVPNQKLRISSSGGGGGGGGGTSWYEEFTATPAQTLFNLANAYVTGINALLVFVNGDLVPSAAYTETSTTSITFGAGWPAFVGGEKVIILLPKGDGKTLVSATDTTPGFLGQKLVAGAGITLTPQNPGADENILISAGGTGSLITVWPGALAGLNPPATNLIVAGYAGVSAFRINCDSMVTGNDWDTSGHWIYIVGTNTLHGAFCYTTAFGSGYNSYSTPAGVGVTPGTPFAINQFMNVLGWNPTLWIQTVGTFGATAHRVTVEVLG